MSKKKSRLPQQRRLPRLSTSGFEGRLLARWRARQVNLDYLRRLDQICRRLVRGMFGRRL